MTHSKSSNNIHPRVTLCLVSLNNVYRPSSCGRQESPTCSNLSDFNLHTHTRNQKKKKPFFFPIFDYGFVGLISSFFWALDFGFYLVSFFWNFLLFSSGYFYIGETKTMQRIVDNALAITKEWVLLSVRFELSHCTLVLFWSLIWF